MKQACFSADFQYCAFRIEKDSNSEKFLSGNNYKIVFKSIVN